MSQENVEIVGRMYDAYGRGDFEVSLSHLDPEIELSQPALEPRCRDLPRTRRRRPGVRAMARRVGRLPRRGGAQIFQLMTLRSEKIVRMRMYYDEAEALEAAGLEE